jgi:hypothetical protein
MLFNFSPQLPESSLLDFLALSEVLICAAVCDVAEFASMRQKILTQPATAVVAKLALGGEQVWEPLRQFLSLDGLTSGHLGSVLLCYANMLRELAATSGAARPEGEAEPQHLIALVDPRCLLSASGCGLWDPQWELHGRVPAPGWGSVGRSVRFVRSGDECLRPNVGVWRRGRLESTSVEAARSDAKQDWKERL